MKNNTESFCKLYNYVAYHQIKWLKIRKNPGIGEITGWMMVLVASPDKQSWIPQTDKVEGKKQLPKVIL